MIKDVLLKDYINNASDIIALSKNDNFSKLLNNIGKDIITIKSHLVHKEDITHLEQFIFNLDMYISFIKNTLNISQQEIRCIVDLTIYDNNDILFDKTYYYDNQDKYINGFKKLLLDKYLDNYSILNKYIEIKKYNFEELINKLNQIKNKAHFYFEDINKNLPYFIEIIDYLENSSNILV